jgi:hypothetical protein
MKAITISQPYASLIASGEKWVENRTWSTNYRGYIAIHAGKGSKYLSKDRLANYPTGCVIAIAKLTACVELDQIQGMDRTLRKNNLIHGTRFNWEQVCWHKYTEGPWCWILEDINKITPVIATGKQGIWIWDCEDVKP